MKYIDNKLATEESKLSYDSFMLYHMAWTRAFILSQLLEETYDSYKPGMSYMDPRYISRRVGLSQYERKLERKAHGKRLHELLKSANLVLAK